MKTVEEMKIRELFRLKENGPVYVRGHYDREIKKYSCTKYDDMNFERFFAGNKTVIVDFEF